MVENGNVTLSSINTLSNDPFGQFSTGTRSHCKVINSSGFIVDLGAVSLLQNTQNRTFIAIMPNKWSETTKRPLNELYFMAEAHRRLNEKLTWNSFSHFTYSSEYVTEHNATTLMQPLVAAPCFHSRIMNELKLNNKIGDMIWLYSFKYKGKRIKCTSILIPPPEELPSFRRWLVQAPCPTLLGVFVTLGVSTALGFPLICKMPLNSSCFFLPLSQPDPSCSQGTHMKSTFKICFPLLRVSCIPSLRPSCHFVSLSL